jgi:myo-inositol-1(or 4)-monophosphatase
MPESLQVYLDFITETVHLAGRTTLGYFQNAVKVDYKMDNSPVTLADRLAEELIRERIEKYYPDHVIIGEEYGLKDSPASTHRWLIDPIDGTKSFIRGVPLYAVLLGLEIEGQVRAGGAYFPALDELICAADGLGCWWNGRRSRLSQVRDLSQAVVAFTDPGSISRYGKQAAWDRLQNSVYYRAGWGDAYGYLLVATGRVEVMLDPIVNPWDCAPFPPIFRELGGYFGDWQGNASIYAHEALATTQLLLPQILSVLGGEND